MKKALTILTLVLILTGSQGAAANLKTVIKLKPDQGWIYINQDRVDVKEPYITEGTTMVPIRVISEAFGAKVEWHAEQKTIRIIHGNNNVKLTIGKASAVIDGVEESLPAKPRLMGGTTMVPLRLISETFSARVDYSSKTQEITVTIPFTNYNSRFKYISKGKIGDSFYGWSVLFPDGCTIVKKDSSGKSVLVRNLNKGYYYYIYNIRAGAVRNEADLLEELLGYVEDEKVVSKEIIEHGGRKWAAIVLEKENEVYEYRAALKGGRIYQIHFYTPRKQQLINPEKNHEYRKVIDSFSLNYSGNVEGIRDINEIREGLYTYYDEKYGWSIDLPSTLNLDIRKRSNSIEIIDEKGEDEGVRCGVEFYSADSSETLDAYAGAKVKELYEDIKKEYIKSLTMEGFEVNGIPARRLEYRVNIGDIDFVFYELYLIVGKYKYNIYLYGKAEIFDGESVRLYNRILGSFTPIQGEKAGRIEDTELMLRGETETYENPSYNWKMSYPASWDIKEGENGNPVTITDRSGLIEVYVSTARDISEALVKQRMQERIDTLAQLEEFTLEGMESVIEKGLPMTRYVCRYMIDHLKHNYTAYIFSVGNQVFGVHFTAADVVNTEANRERLGKLWESMRFGTQ